MRSKRSELEESVPIKRPKSALRVGSESLGVELESSAVISRFKPQQESLSHPGGPVKA